jgi:rSAM/selenodomain-associated transferase 1
MGWSLRVVIPALNEGETLAACLRDLQPLRERGAQVVVADGGSTDTTWALASALADQVIASPRGRAAQMNAGAAWKPQHRPLASARRIVVSQPAVPVMGTANHDAILFLHADTRLPPDADTLIFQALQQGHIWGRFDVTFAPPGRLGWIAAMMNWRSAWSGICTGDQGMFIRRDVFDSLGGFANQPLMEDIEFSKRLKRIAWPVRIRTTVTTSARRWETRGVWRTIGLMWRLRLAYFLGASPQVLAAQYGYRPAPAPATAALAVLAKAPAAGFAKTRLAPLLGNAGAARAQRHLTLGTLQVGSQSGLDSLALWCAPDAGHRFFRALARTRSIACQTQPEGDIGQRMCAVFRHHFEQRQDLPLLLIGTDCAVLAPGHLQQAARALVAHDVVLIPAEDGGYVLIGMRRFVPQAFDNIRWSSPEVMAQTRERLRQAQASWQELPALWDVDEPADWLRLQALSG